MDYNEVKKSINAILNAIAGVIVLLMIASVFLGTFALILGFFFWPYVPISVRILTALLVVIWAAFRIKKYGFPVDDSF